MAGIDSDELEAATERLQQRLVKVGRLKRREARAALGKRHQHLVEEAAEALVRQTVATKQAAPHGSWNLQLAGATADLAPSISGARAGNDGRYSTCDITGVVYRLTDCLLEQYRKAGVEPDYGQVFTETRAAVARLLELHQNDVETAVNRALLRKHANRLRGLNTG